MNKPVPDIITFRVDATTATGLGHFMRCLALAQAWKNAGGSCVFYGDYELDMATSLLRKEKIERGGTGADFITSLGAERSDGIIVLDGYTFEPDLMQTIRKVGHTLLVIDDYKHWPYYNADLVLNQNTCSEFLEYRPKTGSAPLLLCGPKFALMRQELVLKKKSQKPLQDKATNIVVASGGSDIPGLNLRTLQALEKVTTPLRIFIVAGPGSSYINELHALAKESHHHVEIIWGKSNLSDLLGDADMAITAAGSMCWELLHHGVPVLAAQTAENQRFLLETLVQENALISLGEVSALSVDVLYDTALSLINTQSIRAELSQRGPQIVDGQGAIRVARLLKSLLDKKTAPLLRNACPQDVISLWRLANRDSVRRWAFNQDSIDFEKHKKWFTQKLKDEKTAIYVMQMEDVLAGQIRYTQTEAGVAEIDYAVEPIFRGRSLGSQLLSATWPAASKKLKVTVLRGVVINGNIPSARAFEKAGFQLTGLHKNMALKSSVYELKTQKETENGSN